MSSSRSSMSRVDTPHLWGDGIQSRLQLLPVSSFTDASTRESKQNFHTHLSQHSSRRLNEMAPVPMSSQFDEKDIKQPLLPTATGTTTLKSKKEKKSKKSFARRVFKDVFLFVLCAAAFDMLRVLVTRKVQARKVFTSIFLDMRGITKLIKCRTTGIPWTRSSNALGTLSRITFLSWTYPPSPGRSFSLVNRL